MFAQIPHRQTTDREHVRKQKYSAGHMRCCRGGRHHGGSPAHRNAGRPGHTASLWAMKRSPAETHGLLSIFHTASPARCRKAEAEVPHGTRPFASIAKPRQRSRPANREPFQARHRRVDCDHRIDRGHPGRDLRSRVSAPRAARNAGFRCGTNRPNRPAARYDGKRTGPGNSLYPRRRTSTTIFGSCWEGPTFAD